MGTVEIINGCDNSYYHYSSSKKCDYVDTCDQFNGTHILETDSGRMQCAYLQIYALTVYLIITYCV